MMFLFQFLVMFSFQNLNFHISSRAFRVYYRKGNREMEIKFKSPNSKRQKSRIFMVLHDYHEIEIPWIFVTKLSERGEGPEWFVSFMAPQVFQPSPGKKNRLKIYPTSRSLGNSRFSTYQLVSNQKK